MGDNYCLQFVNTFSEGIKETEVSVIILTITPFLKKESLETLTVKKDP